MSTAINLVSVIAPATLPEGTTLQAEVDGKTVTVVVPEGGIGEGEKFEAPNLEEAVANVIAQNKLNVVPPNVIPVGKWRAALFACCETCWCPMFMGWCCTPVLLGQIMQRVNFGWFGCPNEVSSKPPPVCMVFFFVYISCLVIGAIFYGMMESGFKNVIITVMACFFLVIGTFTRHHFRRRYKLPPTYFGDNACDDCMVTWFCSCCSQMQIARQIYEPGVAEYEPFSPNGAKDGNGHISFANAV